MSNPTAFRVDVTFDFTTDGRWRLAEVKDILRNMLLDNQALGHFLSLDDAFTIANFGIGVTSTDQPT